MRIKVRWTEARFDSGRSAERGLGVEQQEGTHRIVTVDSFVRAETDMTMARYVSQGAFGGFIHIRRPVPLDKQDVIRMNRDTLYSIGVFDLSSPVTITKPDPSGRYQSMMLVSEDHSILPAIYDAGEFQVTEEMIGTRYAFVAFRTFADPEDPSDIAAANSLQDGIRWTQADPGVFEIPDWDEESLKTVRHAVNVLAATKTDTSGFFGEKSKLDPIEHLMGTAYGWGGLPKREAVYVNRVPELNDGATPHVLTVKDAPVDGFWSVTVYNADGFMEPTDTGAVSYNGLTAAKNDDGSVTIHFGGDPGAVNFMPLREGWNYVARLYKPRQEVLDGEWIFPEEVPVTH